ncbi:MAG TPA: DNA translocase FtsK 4TM domain-containing protein [Gemmatimonadota bacterium]|nr:DNA translocase FtsK 4TM domain-containing protein [Gemmatimonadota bacterium]
MARRKKPDPTRLRKEILGLLVAATGAFLLLALWPYDPVLPRLPSTVNLVGVVGAVSAFHLYDGVGYGAVVVAGLLLVWGGLLFLDRASPKAGLISAAAAVAAPTALTLMGIVAVWSGGGGAWGARAGRLGRWLAGLAVEAVGVAGAVIACVVILAALAAVVFRISLAQGVRSGVELGRVGGRRAREGVETLGASVADWRARRVAPEAEPPPPEASTPNGGPPAVVASGPRPATPRPAPPRPRAPSARRQAPAIEPEGFIPPLDLLDPVPREEGGQTRDELERLGDVLIEKLRSFHVEGEVVDIHSGPVLTQFEVKPAPGVKVNQIANLADDLALAMRAQRIRIVAPIPGKGAVGIEIPNPRPRMVTIREILETGEWEAPRGKLPLALGREIAGAPIVTDLARMPHLLIAGATGSGKSVCINALVTSLLYRYGPDAVRLIMIDPKMLELIAYNGIPHLLHPVVVEHKHAAKALKWTVAEMERRYRLLAANGVRSLEDFNARLRDGAELEGIEEDERRPLPLIVVLIDELADLMLTVQNEIEEPLARLAQMARAVGIHLVLATQRPSVNVITGVIKANFPSRISFQVSSKIDSRTVLDMNGAEQLLGNGDMLFMPADRAEPLRIQGAYVSTAETVRVVDYLKAAAEKLNAVEVAPPVDIIAEASELEMAVLDERDELFLAAARVVIEHDQGSTSLLQRRLKVGYSRAARILDQLERAHIVGPPDGTKPRAVLITSEELDHLEAVERGSR